MKDIKEIINKIVKDYLSDGIICFDFIEKTYIKSTFIELIEREIDEKDLYNSYLFISNIYISLDLLKKLIHNRECWLSDNIKTFPSYMMNIFEIRSLLNEFEYILKKEKEKLLIANSNLTTKRKVKI